MKNNLLFKVLLRWVMGIVLVGILLFVPAGTLKFQNGWLFIAALFIPMLFTLVYFSLRDPELLEKRIATKEKEDAQKKYTRLTIPIFLAAYIIPGFDYRFGWSRVPQWIVFAGLVMLLFAYIMFIIIMLQNRYASRVVEIQKGQKLINTGLYAIVRHPMYLAASMLYVSSGFVLGSWYALIPLVFLCFSLTFRIKNEEKVLTEGLPGYEEYRKKVRYRMIPMVW